MRERLPTKTECGELEMAMSGELSHLNAVSHTLLDQAARERTVIPGLALLVALAVVKASVLMCFASGFGYMSDELYVLACAAHPA